MKDIALDDLIKEDKEKARGKNKPRAQVYFISNLD